MKSKTKDSQKRLVLSKEAIKNLRVRTSVKGGATTNGYSENVCASEVEHGCKPPPV
jgi:hypothetical protein